MVEIGSRPSDRLVAGQRPFRRHSQLWWDRHSQRAVVNHTEGADPALTGVVETARAANIGRAGEIPPVDAVLALLARVQGTA